MSRSAPGGEAELGDGMLPASEAVQGRIDALAATDDWGICATDLLIRAAHDLGCSDLHFSCSRDAMLARGRREGALFELARLPGDRRHLVVARLKVLAQLPAFLKYEPQDGRIEWRPSPDGAPRLLRASFLPTMHGENVVLRFPEQEGSTILHLDGLGMPPETLAATHNLLNHREGVVVLTGPSSSGKTTTMYAMLDWLHRCHGNRLNMLTIEDPVERDLGFAGQVQVNGPQGLTFERALRAALRQDPNVILVGEVRDLETARTVVQAGMSGHLVITTLHAGRAARVFTRLLSMGLDPYPVASAITGSVAQRLVRTVCLACEGDSCAACQGTGVAGRTAIFEVINVTETLRELMLAKASPAQIAAEAARTCAGDLLDEGRRLLEAGRISQAEYQFLLGAEETEEPAP